MKERTFSPNSGAAPRVGDLPTWIWPAALLLILSFFLGLSSSGDLLAPLVGQAVGFTDYLHEFTHDGRHLLAVPCH